MLQGRSRLVERAQVQDRPFFAGQVRQNSPKIVRKCKKNLRLGRIYSESSRIGTSGASKLKVEV